MVSRHTVVSHGARREFELADVRPKVSEYSCSTKPLYARRG
jgi:hypothetical protein